MKKRTTIKIALCLLLVLVFTALAGCGNSDHVHEWGEWTVVKNATCKVGETLERVCDCGERESKISGEPVSHINSGKSETVKEPTFRESGLRCQICAVCGELFNEKVLPPIAVELLPSITNDRPDPLRPWYNLSTCRSLSGNPVVVLIFVDDNESSWTEEEVLTFTEEHVLVGLDYLEKNAKEWGVDLDFTVESYSTPLSGYEIKCDGVVSSYGSYSEETVWNVFDRVSEDIINKSNWALYSYYKSKYPEDDVIFLCCVNKYGRSWANTARSINDGVREAEHCVVFSEYYNYSLDEQGTGAATIMHEILHLFGAEDYYKPDARKALANKTYPKDIMLVTGQNINKSVIGDLTAYSIGWTDVAPEICSNPKWWE